MSDEEKIMREDRLEGAKYWRAMYETENEMLDFLIDEMVRDGGMAVSVDGRIAVREKIFKAMKEGGASMSKNEYTPWEGTGETELEYFKRLFLESEAEVAEERARIIELVEELDSVSIGKLLDSFHDIAKILRDAIDDEEHRESALELVDEARGEG